jgi:N4-gp56 family major capsid protein
MGLENFIPEFWSDKLFVRLRKSLVFGGVVNRDYEGVIKQMGDTVKINELGPVTVSPYTKGATLSYENLDSAQKQLVIDQASHFAFKIDDIDEAQSNPKLMNGAMDEAAYGIANTIDTFLAGLYTHAGCLDATNMGSSSSPISVSSGNVILVLSYAGRRMSEKNVPEGNRFMIIPPWLHQKLLLAEVGGISATAVPKVFSDNMITSGYVGDALGFRLLLSNNVQNSASNVSAVMALNRTAITYAGQVAEIEAIRLQTTFANAARGLYLYGGKVTQPDALAALHLTEVAG